MKAFTTLCCAAIALGSALYAQSFPDHMTVELKNPMMVGDTRLPAGKVDIQAMRGASDATVLVLRMENGVTVTALASRMYSNDGDSRDDASLILTRHGKDLQLSRVMFGDRVGYQLPVE